MTTYNHTAIAVGAAANASVINAPIGQLDAAIGNLSSLTTSVTTSVVGALNTIGNVSTLGAGTNPYTSSVVAFLGQAALRTTQQKIVPAINELLDDTDAIEAEILTARGGYADLDTRFDNIALAGSNVSTLTNGAANAGQKIITVDSTTGFLAGALIAYTLVGGVIETNTVGTVDSPTQLTCTTNIGSGGIANDTYVCIVPIGVVVSSGAVPAAQLQKQEFDKGLLVTSSTGGTAIWSVHPTTATFGGTLDEILFIGWNIEGISGNRIDTDDAAIYLGFEADYYAVGEDKHYSEAYVEFYDATGAIQRRAWSTSIDRSNGDVTNQFWGAQVFYTSAGVATWQIDTGGNLSSANLVRFTANDSNTIMQLNAAGLAYVSLVKLDGSDVVQVGETNISVKAGLGSGKLAVGEDSPDTKLHVTLSDATTNAITNIATLSHKTSGTAAAGFGSGILLELNDDSVNDQPAAKIETAWNTATTATRKADLVLSAYDTAAREGLRIRGAGSAPAIGFYGVAPIERAVLATGAGATVDNVITALQNLGLVKQS